MFKTLVPTTLAALASLISVSILAGCNSSSTTPEIPTANPSLRQVHLLDRSIFHQVNTKRPRFTMIYLTLVGALIPPTYILDSKLGQLAGPRCHFLPMHMLGILTRLLGLFKMGKSSSMNLCISTSRELIHWILILPVSWCQEVKMMVLLQLKFKRKSNPGDLTHRILVKGNNEVMWAFGPDDSFLSEHNTVGLMDIVI